MHQLGAENDIMIYTNAWTFFAIRISVKNIKVTIALIFLN